jgi:hypothetical protein
VRGFLPYFLFIGAAISAIEVEADSEFVLFWQIHPRAERGDFSMLVSSGLGSFSSRRLLGKSEGRLIKALGSVALLAAVLSLVLSRRYCRRWSGCRSASRWR